MELTKLTPEPSKFFLSSMDVPIHLSPCTLGKMLELERKYGKIETILNEASLENISKIAFTLMVPEDKSLFAVRETETIDDDGKKITESIGGVRLLMSSVSTVDEFKEILMAVFKSFGMASDKVDEVKKKDGSRGPSPIEWDYILDLISHEYGWTTEQIFNLTLVEIFWRVKSIHKRHNNEFREDCIIAGRQLKEEKFDVAISEEQQSVITRDINRMNKKLVMERINGR